MLNFMIDLIYKMISRAARTKTKLTRAKQLAHTVESPQDIDSLLRWSETWKMQFNTSKCVHIQVGAQMPVCDLWLGNMKITQASEFKYLGVHINSRLCWKSHIASTIRKANSTLFLLRRGLVGAPTKIKMLSYTCTSIVRPILKYACQVWSLGVQNLV